MKLLIVTQVVDKNHPILGFFHRWIEEFAKNCEQVHIICLEKGVYELPKNVTVHSLGKDEKETTSVVYAMRLQKISWKLRKEYDVVFVHMIPEYVLAGFLMWKFLGKKIGLWYTHGTVSRSLRIAEKFVDTIFTAAKEGCNINSRKVFVTGHGIDVFSTAVSSEQKNIDLITVGRIAPSKNLEALIDVLVDVKKTSPDTNFTIIGSPVVEEEKQYKGMLEVYISERDMTDSVHFAGTVPHRELPQWFAQTKVFVHAATNGSLDKALIEPLAAGVPVITTAKGAKSLPLANWQVANKDLFVERVCEVMDNYPKDRMIQLQSYVAREHTLTMLVPKICKHYNA